MSHTTSPVTDNVFLYPASAGTMEGPASVNGRASGRTARERSDRKRAKKRSKRDLELRFDDLPSPASDVLVAEDVWAVFRSASVSGPDVVSAHVSSAAAIAAPGTMPLIA